MDITPIIILVAFGGFMLASYIRRKKITKKVLVCPFKSNCETVIFSDYSKFLGIPVEVIGMAYYLGIVIAYGFFAATPAVMPPTLVLGVFSASIAAFLFSVYLTLIQAFAIRQWCLWCLVSAALCTLIFFLAVSISPFSIP